MIKRLPVEAIRTDGGTQARIDTYQTVVAEYLQAMQDGAKFPDILVFFDGKDYWLADGFHRLAAAIKAGMKDIRAEVRKGTQRDAQLYAAGSNTTHGFQRTPADKRRAVRILLEDAEWSAWSSRSIAVHCGVSHTFVEDLRKELSQDKGASGAGLQTPAERRKCKRGGQEYLQGPKKPRELFSEGDGEGKVDWVGLLADISKLKFRVNQIAVLVPNQSNADELFRLRQLIAGLEGEAGAWKKRLKE